MGWYDRGVMFKIGRPIYHGSAMRLDRRRFTSFLAGALGTGALPRNAWSATGATADPCHPAPAVAALTPMRDGVVPISDDERKGRLEKARRLMAEQKLGAILLEPGTSMTYFTGMEWGLSERPFLAVLPAKGDLAF